MKPVPNVVVIWDIDGTIVQPSLERIFLRYMKERHYLRSWKLPLQYAVLLPSSGGQWHRLKLAYLRGCSANDVNSWMDDCFETEIKARLIQPCVDAIAELNNRGIKSILLSGTLSGLAERLGAFLSVPETITAMPEIRGGQYTGRLTKPHPYARRKISFALTWLEQNNYDWSQTVAIADHWQDRFLLDRAGLPIVLNPQEQIADFARSKGWQLFSQTDGSLKADLIVDTVTSFISSR